jgi:hypothetical protein
VVIKWQAGIQDEARHDKSFFDKEKHNSINWVTQEAHAATFIKHFILTCTAPQKKHSYFLAAPTLKICDHTGVRSSGAKPARELTGVSKL